MSNDHPEEKKPSILARIGRFVLWAVIYGGATVAVVGVAFLVVAMSTQARTVVREVRVTCTPTSYHYDLDWAGGKRAERAGLREINCPDGKKNFAKGAMVAKTLSRDDRNAILDGTLGPAVCVRQWYTQSYWSLVEFRRVPMYVEGSEQPHYASCGIFIDP